MMKVSVFIIAFPFFFVQVNAQSGEELFKSVCSACHTINKGRLVGPDLSGVYNKQNNEWLISFIRSSQQMVKSGDPDAVAIFNEFNKVPMPDNNLSDQQILSIIDYIKQVDGNAAGASDQQPAAADSSKKASADTTAAAAPADTIPVNEEAVSEGKSYFSGVKPFVNGSAPCMTCHNINDGSLLGGGKLARDLTTSYNRLGAAGITAILANPPFPAMKAAVPGALTEEEILSLNSLLKSSALSSQMIFPRGMAFLVIAFVVGIFIAVFIFLLYDERKIPGGYFPDNIKQH